MALRPGLATGLPLSINLRGSDFIARCLVCLQIVRARRSLAKEARVMVNSVTVGLQAKSLLTTNQTSAEYENRSDARDVHLRCLRDCR
jgi:hypothetical protein